MSSQHATLSPSKESLHFSVQVLQRQDSYVVWSGPSPVAEKKSRASWVGGRD